MDIKVIRPETLVTTRLVKSEDLNHHGTLFAGRTAEWFVESGFIAATSILNPQSVVCLNIHGMFFTNPARSGDILKFSSAIVYTGRTSVTVYVHVEKRGEREAIGGWFCNLHPCRRNYKACPSFSWY